ncbi:MAG: ATP-binding cassette domain-containing protein [Bacteroidales bacterium]|jgi:cell division transport system ATP-binding protein|nr:ATP-binding cassette domain-containing protein [Bacteroidales bacterium]
MMNKNELIEDVDTLNDTLLGEKKQKDIAIEFKKIDIYQKNLLILPKISLTIREGEFVYLIGKTGSGKSSILKTLIADLPVYGEVAQIVGYDLLNIKTRQIPYLRRKLGFIFQDYQLISDKTVIDNLLFVLEATNWKNKNDMLNRAEEVLTMVGLQTKDFKYPHQLSGGEQQRVCIARALLNCPSVILADEPTGNLDPLTSEELFQMLIDINKTGTTVVMATHNFSMIDKFPSRTLCIEGDELIDSLL